ncbi:MAG: outer membrane protein assembly factor BamD [Acidobacteriota bacterium]
MTHRVLVVVATAALLSGCGPAHKKPSRADRKPATELYQEAEQYMTKRHYNKAIRRYQKIDTVKNPELRAQVHLRMADAYFAQGHVLALIEAQARYQSFLNFFPLSDQAPYAQYQYAVCLQKQINPPERDQTPTRRAIAEFQKVGQLYPNSSWVLEAKTRIAELDDRLTEDSLLKARFYYSRKGYPSAIARLREILKHQPDFSRKDETLFFLGMSLRKGGNEPEAEQVFQQLVDEAPESKFAKKAAHLLQHR